MSDHEGSGTEPDFDDPTYAELRGLLGEAREDAPMPQDVVFRLEATLSGLVAEREDAVADAEESNVVPLRRRAWAPRLLGAAAAVVLVAGVGVGISQIGGGTGSDDKAASADSGSTIASPEKLSDVATGRAATPQPGAALGSASKSPRASFGTFTRAGFSRQVARYVGASTALSYSAQLDGLKSLNDPDVAEAPVPQGLDPETAPPVTSGSGTLDTGGDTGTAGSGGATASGSDPWSDSVLLSRRYAAFRATKACPGPKPTDGSVVLLITFARKPATLVLHPVIDGSQFVAAWSCSGRQLLAATTLQR